jgi:pimeloyl-ACP methyl ester carboxylesterase
VVGAVIVVLSACSGQPGRSERTRQPRGTTSPQLPTASPAPSVRPELAGSRVVRFASTDGVELVGRLWGDGKTGVVLGHGFDEQLGQGGWYPVGGQSFPRALERRGLLVLTFNFRGFTDEDVQPETDIDIDVSNNWRDSIAAVRYIRSQGARRVFLIGASMGGIAALRAGRAAEVDLDGVISLATPQFPSKYYAGEPEANDATPERLRAIDAPLLFIAGMDDVIEGVRFARDAQRMFEAASEPKEIAIVDSGYHSSGLVTSAEAGIVKKTTKLIVDFIEAHN